MTNWFAFVIGFIVSVGGALAIAWPVVTRTEVDIALGSSSTYNLNPTLRGMLAKERRFARLGVVLVIVGSSLQLAGTWLPG